MKSRLANFIITVVIFLIISVFILFGMILWNELKKVETSVEPESAKTTSFEEKHTIDENLKVPEVQENPLNNIQGNGSNQQQIDYSNITVNKYFFNQLEPYSQTIYKAFEANKENMKTGTYQVELGNSFNSLLSQNNGSDELGKYYQSAIEAYTYDNPDVFYLSPNKMYLNIETTTKGNSVSYSVFVNSGNDANYLIDEFSSKEQVNNAIQQIEQVRNIILQNRKSNTYDNIKMVHDFLIENVSYDTSISRDNIYNIYGAMVNKLAVCEGYARSFKYLMDSLGIPCTLVIGKGISPDNRTENHAWNYVQLDNNWYAIDTTWDDPITNGGWVSESNKVRYFLKGSNDMSKDHTPSNHFTDGGKNFNYPPLSATNYQ